MDPSVRTDSLTAAKREVQLDLVFGNYELERVVAPSGDRGVVFLAHELPRGAVDRRVALTVLDDHPLRPQLRDGFERRWALASTLSHPTLLSIRGWGEQGGLSFVATEWLEGHNLSAVLDRLCALQEQLDTRTLASIGIQLAEALCYLHEAVDANGNPLHLVHGSVAPSRVVITDTGYVKLLGFAFPTGPSSASLPSSPAMDVLACTAPETFERVAPSVQADVYALGMLLEALATGTLRYQAESPSAVRDRVAEGLEAPTEQLGLVLPLSTALHQWTDRDPARRPSSCRVLSQTFGRILSQEGGPLQPAEWRDLLEDLFADEAPAPKPALEFAALSERIIDAVRDRADELFIPEDTSEVGADGTRELNLVDTSEEPIPGVSIRPADARVEQPPAPGWAEHSHVSSTFAGAAPPDSTRSAVSWGLLLLGAVFLGMLGYGLFLGTRVANMLDPGAPVAEAPAQAAPAADEAIVQVLDAAEKLLAEGHAGEAANRLEDIADLRASDPLVGLRVKRLQRLSQQGVKLTLGKRALESGDLDKAKQYALEVLDEAPEDADAQRLLEQIKSAAGQ